MLLTFLRDLRDLLASPTSWHPNACVNARGRMLGEYEQLAPTAFRMVPTDAIPCAWCLPYAITYLLQAWEEEGRFFDPPLQRIGLRYSVTALLAEAAGVADLAQVTEHGAALRALDAAIGQCALTRVA